MKNLLRSTAQENVQINLDAYCWTCNHRHKIDQNPTSFIAGMWDWYAKHKGHKFEFLSPSRQLRGGFWDRIFEKLGIIPWYLQVAENADIKIAYASSAAMTITLASLATSSTFLSGRESTSISNTTNKYVDYRVSAKITTGTTPTVDKEIRIYAYSVLDDTPTYPDNVTGSDANLTVSNAYNLDAIYVPLGMTSNNATSNVAYYPRCITLAEAFGFCPLRWGLYVTHSTAVNLNSTGGNHVVTQTAAYFTSI